MTLESSKTLGGVGAILLLIGPLIGVLSYVQPFLIEIALVGFIPLFGFILVLIALHDLASYYKENGIFDNALYGFIAAIVGVVAAVIATVYVAFYTSILMVSTVTPSAFWAMFSVLAILWIFLVISAFFNRRSLKMLLTKTSVAWFSDASLLLIIGAILTIVLIGLVIMWIAVLLVAIAFFQIKPQPEQPAAPTAPQQQTPRPV
jgi:uncharacterized membrane protein